MNRYTKEERPQCAIKGCTNNMPKKFLMCDYHWRIVPTELKKVLLKNPGHLNVMQFEVMIKLAIRHVTKICTGEDPFKPKEEIKEIEPITEPANEDHGEAIGSIAVTEDGELLPSGVERPSWKRQHTFGVPLDPSELTIRDKLPEGVESGEDLTRDVR